MKTRASRARKVGAHVIPGVRELDGASAAGAGSPSRSHEITPPSNAMMEVHPSGEATESWRLHSFFELGIPREQAGVLPTIQNSTGENLISTFRVDNFQGTLQLGRPAGNFVDFSPPPR